MAGAPEFITNLTADLQGIKEKRPAGCLYDYLAQLHNLRDVPAVPIPLAKHSVKRGLRAVLR